MKKGDKVFVTDVGRLYSAYTQMYEFFKLENPREMRHSYQVGEGVMTVVGIAPHLNNKDVILVAIRNNKGESFIFNKTSLKLVESTMRKVTDLVEDEFIHCANKQEGEEICKLMHEAGLRWGSGKTYLEHNHNDMKDVSYSPVNKSYCDLNYVLKTGYTYYSAQDFIKNINIKKQEKVMSNLKIVKSQVLNVKGQEREVTVVVLIDNDLVRAGYSVRVPEDKANPELAVKIATGRALNSKTNLTEMIVGLGMDKKFILYAIAENLLKRIQAGSIEIKGIK